MLKYRIDDLGWYQFELLCQSLLKSICGLGVEAWGGTGDFGRDAYCNSPLYFPNSEKKSKGPFIFQMKFVSEANAAGAKPRAALLKSVNSECKQIKRRTSHPSWREPRHFVFLTNAPLTKGNRDVIRKPLQRVLPNCKITLQGGDDICAMLSNAPNIRVAFPQLLGLSDLRELLASVVEKPILMRSTLAIERAQELAVVFVPTTAYHKTLRILEDHSFGVLTGPPEMGKTTIARLVGLAKLAEGWESYECRTPADFLQKFNRGARQIFIADDAFGSTEYRPEIAHAWGDELDGILRRLDLNHWFLWTSRPAPLKLALARIRLQGKAERFPNPAEVVIDASQLETDEKALMLYRHAKAAGLDVAGKQLVKQHARTIVDNRHFTPERVRRFIVDRVPALLKRVPDGETSSEAVLAAVAQEIEKPTEAMRQSFDSLPPEHQLFLIGMLEVESETADKDDILDAFARHATTVETRGAVRIAEDLEGHFIRAYG